MSDQTREELKKSYETAKSIVESAPDGQPWSPELVVTLSLSILVFGLLVLILMTFLYTRDRVSPLILPAFGVPLIIVAAVVLVVAGFNSQQIAPVIGLLGTIAGYLLGKDSRILPSSIPPVRTTDEAKKGLTSDSEV